MTQDVPSSERISALKIQLDALLHKALAVAPLVHPVFEMRVQSLHGYNNEIVVILPISVQNLPSVMRMQPSGYVLYASCSHKRLSDMSTSEGSLTYSDGVRVRVDAVHYEFVKWPLKIQVCHLSLVKVQS